jgi:hypothetical protein
LKARLASVRLRISSFCRQPTSAACTVSAFCSSAEGVSPLDDADDVIVDVVQAALQLQVDLVLLEACFQAGDHVQQRADRALYPDHLTGQLVDPPGHRRVAREQLVLDLVDVVLQARYDRRVLVDDLVWDRVEYRRPGPGPATRRGGW